MRDEGQDETRSRLRDGYQPNVFEQAQEALRDEFEAWTSPLMLACGFAFASILIVVWLLR